ncbi:MAG: hypothetical protein ACI8ZV_002488, partial [Chitinophagales bacterium]
MTEEFMNKDNKSVKNIIDVDTGIQQLLKDNRVSRRDFLSFTS